MQKLIILEGVDSTGKSSLAKFLARKMGAAYFHASGHRDMYDAMYAHHDNMLNNIEVCLANDLNVVVDRHWPSEYAYATVLRPANLAKYSFPDMVERVTKLKPTYILGIPDKDTYHRYQEGHKDHDSSIFYRLSESEFATINGEYRALFDNIPHVTYSIDDHGHSLDKFYEALP